MGEIMPRGKIERNIAMELMRVTKAEMTLEGYQHLEIGVIQSYVTDLQKILDESEVAQRKLSSIPSC
jgi:hypothetical protein